MIVSGLHHLTISADASAIDACMSFYTGVLNLRIGFRPPLESPGFWLYAGELPLVQLEICDPGEPQAPSGMRAAFACVNLPVTIRRLEDLGIPYTTQHLAETDQFRVFLADPAGSAIELSFDCEKL